MSIRTSAPDHNQPLLSGGGKSRSSDALFRLPDSMTDPFSSLSSRLAATLDSYRYRIEDPRSILEWAMLQTGLNDPLSSYTRQELEQLFPRYARDRDRHLLQLVRQIKQQGKMQLVHDALHSVKSHEARASLARVMREL